MSIEVKQVSKIFGRHRALDNVTLKVDSGELVALLGPSGSGKTTLPRIIAGLEVPNTGRVLFEDRDVSDTGVRDRGVGFVFQHYALFRLAAASAPSPCPPKDTRTAPRCASPCAPSTSPSRPTPPVKASLRASPSSATASRP